MGEITAAIVGSGNIGTDLMMKLLPADGTGQEDMIIDSTVQLGRRRAEPGRQGREICAPARPI
jgi:acetaldehyde dehydrogenase (acetylating)